LVGLLVPSDLEPCLGALLVGAGEVVLAGAAEHDAGAGLRGGAVKAEVADAAVPLGLVLRASLSDLGQPRLQVDDVVQRALRHTRLPGALGRVPGAGTGGGVTADRRGRGDTALRGGALPRVRVPGPVLGVREALAPLLLVRALPREPPPAAAHAARLHGRLDRRRLLAVVHHGHQRHLWNEFKKRKGITQIAPGIYSRPEQIGKGANKKRRKRAVNTSRAGGVEEIKRESTAQCGRGRSREEARQQKSKAGGGYTLQRIEIRRSLRDWIFQVVRRRSIAVDRGR
ncbi:hypothetical protein BAE44_0011038, partial [Dichanthelium oligosanthes]